MNPPGIDRIRHQLLTKRDTLVRWLSKADSAERRQMLGPAGEHCVEEQLQLIDGALDKAASGTLATCVVCHESVEPALLEMDYTACVCLEHFSTAEIRQLEDELQLASVVQRALLPQQVPQIDGVELAAFSRPAQIIGGDYFDFVRFRDGCHGLVIADVSGHGVAASLLMASIQTALHALVPANDSPAAVMHELNRIFYHNIHFTTFVTVFLGRIDTDSGTLTYCNAGHNPPLVVHGHTDADVEISWLQPTGAAIGLVEGNPLSDATAELGAGDLLLLYTDGVTEAADRSDEQWGTERLAEVVQAHAADPVNTLIQSIRDALRDFTAGQTPEDDTTLVACRIAA